MPLWKTKALNLTEREVRYAMRNSKSNAGAARFIGCALKTYKKYATLYVDEPSGLTLWDLHWNQQGRGLKKHMARDQRASLEDIFAGKHPNYDRRKLAARLIDELIVPEECDICGFSERRITDYKVPLALVWKDGDKHNHSKDNLQFICYNCYFLTYDDVFYKSDKVTFK